MRHTWIFHMLFSLASSLVAEELYVFFPTTVRPQVLQARLASACPGINVLVFGRYQDFLARTLADKPTAILCNPLVFSQFPDYLPQLEGVAGNNTLEPYVLLSVNTAVSQNISSKDELGIVDFLGRKNLDSFTDTFFTQQPRLKIVTKVEDLLPLLTFDMVKAVVIPLRHVTYFKEISQLNFIVTKIPHFRVGIVAFAEKKGMRATSVEKAVQEFNPTLLSLLGASRWK